MDVQIDLSKTFSKNSLHSYYHVKQVFWITFCKILNTAPYMQ